jgi:uncharacterized membrane protein
MKILKAIALMAILLCTVGAVNAQENESQLPTFSETVGIGPPALPEADAGYSLILELRDIQTKELLADSHVTLELTNLDTGETTSTIRYSESGTLEETLSDFNWEIVIKLDMILTEGKDYYSEISVDLQKEQNMTVYMNPVGSVRGTVYKGDKVMRGTRIKFECSSAYGDTSETTTDDFGSFRGDWLPVGSCMISALDEGWVGNKEVVIEGSALQDIRIDLTSEVAGGYATIIIVVLVILIAATVGGYVYYKKPVKPKKEKEVEEKGLEVTSHMHSIMRTLRKEEKDVVQFLIDNNGESTQAKVYHATGIPKASLSRYILSLEHKKIVQTKMLGKVKKLELTPFFLGKEETEAE